MNSVGEPSRALNSAMRGLLYLVKDKLYPSWTSNLITPYHAPPFGLRFGFIIQLRYFLLKITKNKYMCFGVFGSEVS